MTRVLIIGGIAAGMRAAVTARRRQPDLDILILRDFSPFMQQSTTRPTSNVQRHLNSASTFRAFRA